MIWYNYLPIKIQTLTNDGWYWSSGYDVNNKTIEGAIEYCKKQIGKYRVVGGWEGDSRITPEKNILWTSK